MLNTNEWLKMRCFLPKGNIDVEAFIAQGCPARSPRQLVSSFNFEYNPFTGQTRGGFPKAFKNVQEANQFYGIYWIPLGCNSDKDFLAADYIFVEWDDLSWAQQYEHLEQIEKVFGDAAFVVKTQKSLHCYWRLDETMTDGELWNYTQKRFAHYCNSDQSIVNPSRCMRFPGFDHLVGNGSEVIRTPVELVKQTENTVSYEIIDNHLPAYYKDATLQQAALGDRLIDLLEAGYFDDTWEPSARKGWGTCRCMNHKHHDSYKADPTAVQSSNSLHVVTDPNADNYGAFVCKAGCSGKDVYKAAVAVAKDNGHVFKEREDVESDTFTSMREVIKCYQDHGDPIDRAIIFERIRSKQDKPILAAEWKAILKFVDQFIGVSSLRPVATMIDNAMAYEVDPRQIFPDVLTDYLCSQAVSFDARFENFLPQLFSSVSSLVADRFVIKSLGGRVDPLLVNGILVGDTGTGKTPMINAILKGIHNLDDASAEEYQAALDHFNSLSKHEQQENPEPNQRFYYVTETTRAGMTAMSEKSQRGVLINIDEAGKLISNDGNDLNMAEIQDDLLSQFNGTPTRQATRQRGGKAGLDGKGSIKTFPFVGGCQPQHLLKGSDTKGLFARFLVSMIEKYSTLREVTTFNVVDTPVSSVVLDNLFEELDQLDGGELTLTPVAQEAALGYINELFALKRKAELYKVLDSYSQSLPKIDAYFMRITGLLHIINQTLTGGDVLAPVTVETVTAARSIAEYFRSQALLCRMLENNDMSIYIHAAYSGDQGINFATIRRMTDTKVSSVELMDRVRYLADLGLGWCSNTRDDDILVLRGNSSENPYDLKVRRILSYILEIEARGEGCRCDKVVAYCERYGISTQELNDYVRKYERSGGRYVVKTSTAVERSGQDGLPRPDVSTDRMAVTETDLPSVVSVNEDDREYATPVPTPTGVGESEDPQGGSPLSEPDEPLSSAEQDYLEYLQFLGELPEPDEDEPDNDDDNGGSPITPESPDSPSDGPEGGVSEDAHTHGDELSDWEYQQLLEDQAYYDALDAQEPKPEPLPDGFASKYVLQDEVDHYHQDQESPDYDEYLDQLEPEPETFVPDVIVAPIDNSPKISYRWKHQRFPRDYERDQFELKLEDRLVLTTRPDPDDADKMKPFLDVDLNGIDFNDPEIISDREYDENWSPSWQLPDYDTQVLRICCDIEAAALDDCRDLPKAATKPDSGFVTAIGLSMCLGDGGYTRTLITQPKSTGYIPDQEMSILAEFFEYLAKCRAINASYHVLAGHNFYGYDLPFIWGRANKHRESLKFVLSPDAYAIYSGGSRSEYTQRFTAGVIRGKAPEYNNFVVPGYQIVDTMMMCAEFDKVASMLSSCALKVAPYELDLLPEGRTDLHWRELEKCAYGEDGYSMDVLAPYLEDDLVATEALLENFLPTMYYQLNIFPLSLQQMGLASPAKKFESELTRYYKDLGWDMRPLEKDDKVGFEGGLGYINPGYYAEATELDFSSLYPSLIIHYRLGLGWKDPHNHFLAIMAYARNRLFSLKAQIKEAEAAGDKKLATFYSRQRKVSKVIANGGYGFTTTNGYKFNYYAAGVLTTALGRQLIFNVGEEVKKRGYPVIFTATDAVLYDDSDHTMPSARDLCAEINALYPEMINLAVEFERMPTHQYREKNYLVFDPETGEVDTAKGIYKKRNMAGYKRKIVPEYYRHMITQGRDAAEDYIANIRASMLDGTYPVEDLVTTRTISVSETKLPALGIGQPGDKVVIYVGCETTVKDPTKKSIKEYWQQHLKGTTYQDGDQERKLTQKAFLDGAGGILTSLVDDGKIEKIVKHKELPHKYDPDGNNQPWGEYYAGEVDDIHTIITNVVDRKMPSNYAEKVERYVYAG